MCRVETRSPNFRAENSAGPLTRDARHDRGRGHTAHVTTRAMDRLAVVCSPDLIQVCLSCLIRHRGKSPPPETGRHREPSAICFSHSVSGSSLVVCLAWCRQTEETAQTNTPFHFNGIFRRCATGTAKERRGFTPNPKTAPEERRSSQRRRRPPPAAQRPQARPAAGTAAPPAPTSAPCTHRVCT